MNDETSNTLVLQLFGIGLLIISCEICFLFPFWFLCLVIWPVAILALIAYSKTLSEVRFLSAQWQFEMWLALFFPRRDDPLLTNFKKLLWLLVCGLSFFGLDTFVFPNDELEAISFRGKVLWIVSLLIAGILSVFIQSSKRKKHHI